MWPLNCLVSPGITLKRDRYVSARTVNHVWPQRVERQRLELWTRRYAVYLKILATGKRQNILNSTFAYKLGAKVYNQVDVAVATLACGVARLNFDGVSFAVTFGMGLYDLEQCLLDEARGGLTGVI